MVKILKIGTHQIITYQTLIKIKIFGFSGVIHLKDADGLANSVDPDQTAPWGAVWSRSALFSQNRIQTANIFTVQLN